MKRTPCLAFAVLVIATLPAFAQDHPELITDRPDQTESSAVVAPGYVQIETGFVYSREAGDSGALEYPTTLLRVGVVDRLEARIGVPGFVSEFEGNNATGLGDAELGLKLRLIHENGPRPEIALLASTSVPIGHDAFSSDRFDPAFRFAFSHTLTERFSLGYNAGAAWETAPTPSGKTTTTALQYTIAGGIGITEKLGAFVELFGDIGLSAPGGPAHSLDGGLTYLIRPDIQFDVSAGFGLTEEAPDYFLGAGISVRLPG